MEVNRLLGWAVSRLKHYYERKQFTKGSKSKCSILDADIAAARTEYLGKMRILHHEAVADQTYMKLYYDNSTQIINNGGLTLISAKYFPFGYELLRRIRQSFSENDLKRNGNQSVVMAFNTLVKTKSIRAVFDACDDTVETLLDEKSKDILFQELVRKVFHARINETIKKYKEVHFGRHSKKGDEGTTFRGFLRARTKKNPKKK